MIVHHRIVFYIGSCVLISTPGWRERIWRKLFLKTMSSLSSRSGRFGREEHASARESRLSRGFVTRVGRWNPCGRWLLRVLLAWLRTNFLSIHWSAICILKVWQTDHCNHYNNQTTIQPSNELHKLLCMKTGQFCRFLFYNLCAAFFADNHDIISMKFYETEVPVLAEEKADEDRTKVVPFASGAEPFRGTWNL